jgi:hypothetical protein
MELGGAPDIKEFLGPLARGNFYPNISRQTLQMGRVHAIMAKIIPMIHAYAH